MSARWKLTDHAKARCEEMGLTRSDVMSALAHADRSYPQPPEHRGFANSEPMRNILGEGLLIVADPERRRIITVSWDRPGRTFTDRATGAC